jgi:xanthine dehydrogenase YagR molybdenum-binding subunit
VVVAETRDQAAHACTLIEVEYAVEPPVVFSRPIARDAVVPPQRLWPLASSSGDSGKAIADAPVKIETVYTMPDRDHDYSTTVPA